MGLFNFFKKSGKKVIKEDTNAPSDAAALKRAKIEQLEDSLKMLNMPVKDLQIDLHDDQVTVRGEAETQEVREKVVLALGNIQDIACVDDQMTVTREEPEAVFYEVKSGDSLSKIAKHFYGDAMQYQKIFEANTPMLEDPDKIYPGQQLRIPQAR